MYILDYNEIVCWMFRVEHSTKYELYEDDSMLHVVEEDSVILNESSGLFLSRTVLLIVLRGRMCE